MTPLQYIGSTIVSAQEKPSTSPTRKAYVFCAVNSAIFIILRGEQFHWLNFVLSIVLTGSNTQSLHIVRNLFIIKSRISRWVEHVARMEESRSDFKM